MNQPDKIEKKCWCGEFRWSVEWEIWFTGFAEYISSRVLNAPFSATIRFKNAHCWRCGFYLAADGIAYRMVKAEEVAEHWGRVSAQLDEEMKQAGIAPADVAGSLKEFFANAYPFTAEALDRLSDGEREDKRAAEQTPEEASDDQAGSDAAQAE